MRFRCRRSKIYSRFAFIALFLSTFCSPLISISPAIAADKSLKIPAPITWPTLSMPYHEACPTRTFKEETSVTHICRDYLVGGGPEECEFETSEDGRGRSRCKNLPLQSGNYELQPFNRKLLAAMLRFQALVFSSAARYEVDPTLIYALWLTRLNRDAFDADSHYQLERKSFLYQDSGFIDFSVYEMDVEQNFTMAAEKWLAAKEERAIRNTNEIRSAAEHLDIHFFDLLAATIKVIENKIAIDYPGAEISPATVISLYEFVVKERGESRDGSNFNTELQVPLFPLGWIIQNNWSELDEFFRGTVPQMELSHARLAAKGKTPNRGVLLSLGTVFRKEKYFRIQDTVALFQSPDSCEIIRDSRDSRPGSEMRERLQAIRGKNSFPKGYTGSGVFEILSQTRTCEEDWSLVAFKAGSLGWLRNSDIQEEAISLELAPVCRKEEYLDYCQAQITEIVGAEGILDVKLEQNLIATRLVGFPELSAEVNHRKFRSKCLEAEGRAKALQQFTDDMTEYQEKLAKRENRQSTRGDWSDRPFRMPRKVLDNYYTKSRDGSLDLVLLDDATRKFIDEKVLEMKLRFQAKLGFDPFLRGEVFAGFLDWYEVMQGQCNFGTLDCYVPKRSEYINFFNLMDPDNFVDPTFIRESGLFKYMTVMDEQRVEMSDVSVLTPAIHDRKTEELRFAFDSASLSTQMQIIENECTTAFTLVEGLRDSFRSQIQKIESEIKGHPLEADIRLEAMHVNTLVGACQLYELKHYQMRGLDQLVSIHANAGIGTTILGFPLRREQDQGYYDIDGFWALAVDLPNSFFEAQVRLGVESAVERFRRYRENADEYIGRREEKRLASRFAEFLEGLGDNSNPPQIDCQFNPIASAERIRKILALDCVDGVILPENNFLRKAFGEANISSATLPIKEHDRVLFRVGRECE